MGDFREKVGRRPARARPSQFDTAHSTVMVLKIVDGVKSKVRRHKYLFYSKCRFVLIQAYY